MPQRQERRLKIVACRQIYTGVNQLGHQYTIYEVDAQKADGSLVKEKLRSFAALPIGETVEVEIEPFESEAHGRSFTLHPKRATSPRSTEQLNEIKGLLEEMRTMFTALERRVEALEKQVAQRTQTAGQTW